MTAMFPDSGVPYLEARNSLADPATQNCNELWYSTTRCEPRFDPAAANALLAELVNLVNRGEVNYDCRFLDQVERSVRYLIQRGLPHAGFMRAGPLDYTLTLDPELTRYNDHLTLIIVPEVNNAGPVRVDVNGRGLVPILRNDLKELVRHDLWAGIPILISYWNGAFTVVGLVRSQVALMGGQIDGWVRTDGDDLNGDGTSNTPEKAFKTIAGAYDAIGRRYAQSPGFSINIKLGIPGVYEGAVISNAANTLTVTGSSSNKAAYQIRSTPDASGLGFFECNNVVVSGITLLLDKAGQEQYPIGVFRSVVHLINVRVQSTIASNKHIPFVVGDGALYFSGGIEIFGAGTMNSLMDIGYRSSFADGASPGGYSLTVTNCAFSGQCLGVHDLSTLNWGPNEPSFSNVSGTKFACATNSILHTHGVTIPGTLPGTASYGGQVLF